MESHFLQILRTAQVTPTLWSKRTRAAGVLAALLISGLMLTQISPSLSAAIVQSGQRAARDAEAMLAARSPGDRPEGTLLTKVKRALGYDAEDHSGVGSSTTPRLVKRSRLIPRRKTLDEPAQESIPLDLVSLLAPLEGLGNSATEPQLASVSLPTNFPILLGNAGGSGGSAGGGLGGGGGGGSGGTPISGVLPVITPGTPATPTPQPTSPVPEPSTWMSMMAGLAFVGAAMRRRRRVAPLPV